MYENWWRTVYGETCTGDKTYLEQRKHVMDMMKTYSVKVQGHTLTQDDIGRQVYYVPPHAQTHGVVLDPYHPDIEKGVITSWGANVVFVLYEGDRNSEATYPKDLYLKGI